MLIQINGVTDEVKMNCLDIEIKTAMFKSENDDCQFLTTNIAYDEDQETVTLKFPQTLNKGLLHIYIIKYNLISSSEGR